MWVDWKVAEAVLEKTQEAARIPQLDTLGHYYIPENTEVEGALAVEV